MHRWLAAMLLLLLCACQAPAPRLENTTWRWLTVHHPDNTVETIDSPHYTLKFLPHDQIAIAEADCNVIASNYTLDRDSLTLNPGAASLNFCGPQSLFTRYLGLLSHVTHYELTQTTLKLTVDNDGTAMLFVDDSSPIPVAQQPRV